MRSRTGSLPDGQVPFTETAPVCGRKRRRSLDDTRERRREKEAQIAQLVQQEFISRKEIRSLALSEGGLLENRYRKVLWCRHLGVREEGCVADRNVKLYKDYTQVCLDVHRVHARVKKGLPSRQVRALQRRLTNVIVKSLADRLNRHYYQGYHDVSLTMLYVLGERLGGCVMSRLCGTHLSSHIRQNLDETSQQMKLIVPLVSQRSPELSDFILRSEAGTMFSLSWIITWFAYVIKDEDTIYRLYDVFITSPPLMPVYLSAAILLYRKREIVQVECELSSVHQVLHILPQDLPWEPLICDAVDLLREFPPHVIETLPIKQHEIILKVPRYGYLDWSTNWAKLLLDYVHSPAGIAITSSFIVGVAAFVISTYTSRFSL